MPLGKSRNILATFHLELEGLRVAKDLGRKHLKRTCILLQNMTVTTAHNLLSFLCARNIYTYRINLLTLSKRSQLVEIRISSLQLSFSFTANRRLQLHTLYKQHIDKLKDI